MALRIAGFEDPARFKQRVDGIIRRIRTSRRAAGVERLYAPGGLEAETEALYRSTGIPLNAVTLQGLRDAAERLGVATTILKGQA